MRIYINKHKKSLLVIAQILLCILFFIGIISMNLGCMFRGNISDSTLKIEHFLREDAGIIEGNTKIIGEKAKDIVLVANKIKLKSNKIHKEADGIIENASIITLKNSEIALLTDNLIKTDKAIAELNKEIKSAEKDKEHLLEENKSLKTGIYEKQQNMWLIFTFICGGGLIAGIFMVVNGRAKTGIGFILSSIMALPLVYFFANYGWVVSIAGGVLFLGFFIVMGFTLLSDKKSIIALKDKMIEEIIETSEEMKYNEWSDELKIKANKIQSKDTQNIIKEIKNKPKKI